MNRAALMAGLILAWLAGGVGPAAGAVYIDGTNFAQRSAAFLRHCATAKPRREDYAKEAMAYHVARLLDRKSVV